MKISTYFKSIDAFGKNTGFIHEDNNDFKTNLGAILSILIVIACTIITILFGKEIFERKNPNVSESSEFSSVARVEMLDWPVFFILSDTYGNVIDNPFDYYNIATFKTNFSVDYKVDFSDYTPFHEVVRCNMSHFEAVKGKIDDTTLDLYLNNSI